MSAERQISYYVIPILKDRKPLYKHEEIVEDVISLICQTYDITRKALLGKKRDRELVFARHLAIFLVRKKTSLTVKRIGEIFDRDHTSIIHATVAIQNYIDTDSFNKRQEILSLY